MSETLQGIVERITYHNPSSHYAVARLMPTPPSGSGRRQARAQPGAVTIVGYFPVLGVGESLRILGEWVVHPEYGRQFKVQAHELLAPTTAEGIERYLASGAVRGVGPVTARRIVQAFGVDALTVVESSPERLTEIEGIGSIRAETIVRAMAEHRDTRDIMIFLQSHGVTPGFAGRIYRHYGRQTVSVVRENPYRLADEVHGIGFRTADRLAANLGVEPTSPYRVRAGLRYVLTEASTEGHVYLPRDVLVEQTCSALGIDNLHVDSTLAAMADDAGVVIEETPHNPWPTGDDPTPAAVYLGHLYEAERGVADSLTTLVADCSVLDDAETIRGEIRRLTAAEGQHLGPEQADAVELAFTSGVAVITGGPGTGKTTCINCLLKLFEGAGLRAALAAPTGRAAKRLAEATGREARTIHRLLEYAYSPDTLTLHFGRDAGDPLDAQAVIVDEVSMVDLPLLDHLLQALRPGTRLVMVGDADQLPPVGPGNALRDIIRSGTVPVATLTHIFRQARESLIVVNAHRVNRGEMPLLNARDGDFFFVERDTPEAILEELITLCSERLPSRVGLDPMSDIQVITPMRRTLIGVDHLNQELQRVLNPRRAGHPELTQGGTTYRLQDKVMQIRNDYEKGVFNGDIGQIAGVDLESGELTVSFPDATGPREIGYDRADLEELVLAYAISVHKSQGSEYPAVVMPVSTQHYVMLQRNLLYTGITRARRLVTLVGTRKALGIAVRNSRVDQRFSRLAGRLAAPRR
ncbi:MAG TPA: ATP-dependent RecD-like DNA helicase [Bacillota bacterium]|nr:ATP-dependent RecD-like DNA helicase [Bacillota bacterium]